jgi:hypothetical protein
MNREPISDGGFRIAAASVEALAKVDFGRVRRSFSIGGRVRRSFSEGGFKVKMPVRPQAGKISKFEVRNANTFTFESTPKSCRTQPCHVP